MLYYLDLSFTAIFTVEMLTKWIVFSVRGHPYPYPYP